MQMMQLFDGGRTGGVGRGGAMIDERIRDTYTTAGVFQYLPNCVDFDILVHFEGAIILATHDELEDLLEGEYDTRTI